MILKTDHVLLKNREVHIKKVDDGFSVKIRFTPAKGFSSTMLNSIKLKEPVELKSGSTKFYLPEHSLLISGHTSSFETFEYALTGTITQITTIKDELAYPSTHTRIIIPIKKGRPDLMLVQGYFFENDVNNMHHPLVKITIEDEEFHFYEFQNDGYYLAVESVQPVSLKKFQHIVRAISNAYGFLSGNLFLDEGYFLFSDTADFAVLKDIYYTTFRDSIKTSYALYTTNPYSLYPITATDKAGILKQSEEIKNWYEKVPEFSPEVFSKLCELFYLKEPFSRAAIVMVQANTLALEIKGSAYSVALETITNQLLKDNGIDFPKPIEDSKQAEDFINKLKALADEAFPGDNQDHKTLRRILHGKFNYINAPTNADKLSKPFALFNYTLLPYELKVLKDRNQYQHGKLPARTAEDNVVFREVYFSCVVLHRLIAILILKSAGFSGYIINYPKLHEHITGTVLDEDFFYKI
ncbi:hypothetical protein PQ469_24895 [Mucilaginibacter sp. KACC 22773]|uniref:hypothetical protein n=1 Tax=Mucilaginibacter sp. KACC 22773 TaxID=3025671 RepID=UPI0023659D73|nr:hypothetical protein [Mucilaginibacter sp. KACC 22773]WDF77127.1 hypothetical protein PQ469_24895 [Mucilaginibacter sp. KACC 22773]